MEGRLLIFFGVLAALLAAVTAYLAWRLLAGAGLAPRKAAWVRWALVACAVLALATFVLGRSLPAGPATRALHWTGFSAMGVLLVLLPFVLARDLVLLAARLARGRPHPATTPASGERTTRRDLLGRVTRRAALGGSAAVLGASIVQTARGPDLVRVPVPLRGLPPSLEGFRIVQISDLHVGPMLGRDFAATVTAQVSALAPDLIAVTGDLVDGRPEALRPLLEPLRGLRARHGAWFVTGNHEYYWRGDVWSAEARRLGMTVLLNEHRVIEHDGARVLVAGVTDYSAHRLLAAHRSDPAAAIAGAPAVDVRLLLAHQPRSLYAAQGLGFDLQLSGHTHGGQFFPWNLLLRLVQPAVAGMHRFDDMLVYVNRGTGFWGPPLRSPGRSEITLLELTRLRS